ncbi:MAG: hypothetical protein COA96_03190 [SAR86 cluster bacterium]|uniref:DUF1697 domain-containing protein n=1 Tax=SAR86 cluster bacterium TaxID=2030880 RepID=A0A2A5B8S5_9GAMM|nr:MAG: hypothetical protein COA96_03190 [SAR86 cluster bacterium]
MGIFIALFRGINVGGRNILPMKELTLLLEESSYSKVKTYIQSGNVVFESNKPPKNVDLLIESQFGFKPEVMIISKKDFSRFVRDNPYSSLVGKEIHLFFCNDAPKPDIDRIEKLKSKSEKYSIKGKVFYLHAPDGIGRSKLAAGVEKCLGVAATARNLNTVNKLIEMTEIV